MYGLGSEAVGGGEPLEGSQQECSCNIDMFAMVTWLAV